MHWTSNSKTFDWWLRLEEKKQKLSTMRQRRTTNFRLFILLLLFCLVSPLHNRERKIREQKHFSWTMRCTKFKASEADRRLTLLVPWRTKADNRNTKRFNFYILYIQHFCILTKRLKLYGIFVTPAIDSQRIETHFTFSCTPSKIKHNYT